MHNPYIPLLTEIKNIVSENKVNDIKTLELVFKNEEDYKAFSYIPGQFAEISLIGKGECPIGIASSPTEEDSVKFTIKKMGSVTTAFHNCEVGDIVGIRGPCGNGWPVEEMKGKNIVVIGGGFAFSTLRSLVLYLLDEKYRKDYGDITVIYGNRDSGEVLYTDVLDEWKKRDDINVVLTIDRAENGWTDDKKEDGSPPKETEPKQEPSGESRTETPGPDDDIPF